MTSERPIVPHRGFTLIELVVSMTLLGVVITLLFSALWFAVRSWDAVERRRDAAHTFALIQGVLAQQLRQARPLYVADARDSQRKLAFAGEADRISYIAPLSRGNPILYANTLYLEHGAGGGILHLRYAPFHPVSGAIEDSVGESVELMTQVDALDVAYFGAPEAGTVPAWLPYWRDARSLPERIRIRITTHDTHIGAWPELLVCPGGGAGCLAPAGTARGLRTTQSGRGTHGG